MIELGLWHRFFCYIYIPYNLVQYSLMYNLIFFIFYSVFFLNWFNLLSCCDSASFTFFISSSMHYFYSFLILDRKCSGIEILFLRINRSNYFIYLPFPIIYYKYPDAVFTAFVNSTNF